MDNINNRLSDALRALPDDHDMIEHNPDEGARYFCCGQDVSFNVHPSRWKEGSEHIGGRTHAAGCWYVEAREALAAYEAQQTGTQASPGEHTAEPWRYNLHHIQTTEEVIGVLPRVANARRIVACVNACAGIPTETLEFLAPVGLKAIAAKWGGA